MFKYRVGWLGWKVLARLGVPLKINLKVMYDPEAKVYVATTDDFLPEVGFACEAPTLDGLQTKAQDMILDVLDFIFDKKTASCVESHMPRMIWAFA